MPDQIESYFVARDLTHMEGEVEYYEVKNKNIIRLLRFYEVYTLQR